MLWSKAAIPPFSFWATVAKTRLLAVVGCKSMELTSRSEEYCGQNASTDIRVAERTLESIIAYDDNGG